MKTIERKKRSLHLTHADGKEWVGATISEEKTTLASRAIVFVLCLAMVVTVLAYGAVDAWALGLQSVGASIIGLLWLWDAWRRRELSFNQTALQIPLLAFIVLGLIQLLPLRNVSALNEVLKIPAVSSLSLDPYATRMFVAQLAIYLIFFAAALTYVNTQKRLRVIVATLVTFGTAVAAFALIQGFAAEGKIYGSRETVQANPYGTFVNGHHFASLLVMLISLTLGLIYARALESEVRALHIFAAFVMGVSLIFSSSRGAVLSLLAVLIFLSVLTAFGLKEKDAGEEKSGKLRKTLMLAGSGVLLVAVLVGAVSILGGDNSLMRAVGLNQSSGDISSGRIHFWQTSVEIIKNNPILGVGLDAFGVAYTRYDTWNGTFRVERAHNDYLQVLAETGIVGFISLIIFLALLFRQGWRIASSSKDRFRRGVALGALAGCFGVAVHSFFDFPLRTPANALVFLTLATLATVVINYPKLHRKNKN